MGMFDTVRFECPNCGTVIEEQSKAGDLNCDEFPATAVPAAIAASLDGEVVSCSQCFKHWRITSMSSRLVAMTLVRVKGDD